MNLKDKQNLYKRVFGSEEAKTVLADLNAFCYATKTIASPDISMYEAGRKEGRREVFLQIMNMVNVEFDEYYEYDPEVYS